MCLRVCLRPFVCFSKHRLLILSTGRSAWLKMMQSSFNGLFTALVVFYFTSPRLAFCCCHRDESAGTTHHAVISAAEPAISNLSEDMHAQMPLLLESMEVVLPHPDLTR